jgi:hypothetical protein
MAENLLLINLLSGYDSNRVRRRNFKELGKRTRVCFYIKDQHAIILEVFVWMLMVDVTRLTVQESVIFW